MDNFSFVFFMSCVCALVLFTPKLTRQIFKHVISYILVMAVFIVVMGDVYLLEAGTSQHLVELGLLALVVAVIINTVNTLVKELAE